MKTLLAILCALFGAQIMRQAMGLGFVAPGSSGGKTFIELTEARAALITEQDGILDAPAETRGEGDASEQVLSKEQRDRNDAIEIELKALDKKIETEERRLDRKNEQTRLESRNKTLRTPRVGVPDVNTGFSQSEKRDLAGFRLATLIQDLSEGRSLDGIEAEMAQDGRSEAVASGIEVRGRSVMVSGKALQSAEQRDLTATGGTGGNQGGMTVPTNKLGLLDSLMHGNPIAQLGGTVLTNLVGNFDLPRIVDGTAPAKKGENAAADEYDPTTAQVQFTPKRLPTVLEVSQQLLAQGNEGALMAFLQRHLISKLMQVMGKACINGGGTNEAEGILQTSGIAAVAGGTNGAAISWANLVALETALGSDDALVGNLSYLTNSKVIGAMKSTAKVASSDSAMILDDRAAGLLNGHGILGSNAVPSTLTKGSSSGNCSAAIFGNFADFYLAQWSGIEFMVNPYSKDTEGLVRINASVYYDGHVIRPESFAAIKDITTA